jgi:hypothetical protein
MSIVAVLNVPNMTERQYKEVVKGLIDIYGPDLRAQGRSHHVAFATEQGWMVVDVWDSPAQLARFGEHLRPLLAAAGVDPLPVPRVYPVHHVVS